MRMILNVGTYAWRASILAVFCLCPHFTGLAGSVVWKTSSAQAVAAARDSARLILLLAGRETCANCQYMKYTVCESAAVRRVLDTNYICWFCPVDTSTEWYSYASGLGSFTLPLICVLDPGSPTTWLDRSTSTQTTTTFAGRLNSHLPTTAITLAAVRAAPPRLRWATENQTQYRVLRSEDLVQWVLAGSIIVGTGLQYEFLDSSSAPRRFYRVMGFR